MKGARRGVNNFGALPIKTEAQHMSEADLDDRLFEAGKNDASMKLPRFSSVECKDEREEACYNMGYSAGEYEDE